MIDRLRGHAIYDVSPQGKNKATRAEPLTIAITRREVSCVRAPWFGEFMDELADFSREDDSGYKDQVDALSQAVSQMLLKRMSISRRLFTINQEVALKPGLAAALVAESW
jgi:phage terminase large subunit-like protein